MNCETCNEFYYSKCFQCEHGDLHYTWSTFVRHYSEIESKEMVLGTLPVRAMSIRFKKYPPYYYDPELKLESNIAVYWGLICQFIQVYPHVPWNPMYDNLRFVDMCQLINSDAFGSDTVTEIREYIRVREQHF